MKFFSYCFHCSGVRLFIFSVSFLLLLHLISTSGSCWILSSISSVSLHIKFILFQNPFFHPTGSLRLNHSPLYHHPFTPIVCSRRLLLASKLYPAFLNSSIFWYCVSVSQSTKACLLSSVICLSIFSHSCCNCKSRCCVFTPGLIFCWIMLLVGLGSTAE